MPGYNKYYRGKKKNASSRLSGSNKRYDNKQDKAIKSLQRQIKVLKKQPETKYLYTTRTYNALASTTPQFTSLNVLPQGDGSNERIGDRIRMVGLMFNAFATHTSTDATVMRVVIFRNTQTNNSVANDSSEILESTFSDLDRIIGGYNKDFVGKGNKYQILFNKRYHIAAGASSGPSADLSNNVGEHPRSLFISKWIPLHNQLVHFSGNAGTAADIVDNSIKVMWLGGDTDMSYGWQSCLHYTDV